MICNKNLPSRRGRNSPLDRSQIITKGMWHNLNIIGVIISSRTGNTGGTCNSPWGTWGTCNTWIWSWLGWRFRTATSGWGPTLVCSSIWTSATIYRINVNAPEKINLIFTNVSRLRWQKNIQNFYFKNWKSKKYFQSKN